VIAPYLEPAGSGDLWRELRAKCEFYDYGTDVSGIEAPADPVQPEVGE
jgi:hypothetical protein